MNDISRSVVKKDHAPKMSGRSVYVADYETARGGRPILTGRLLRSTLAHARVLGVDVPELPEGYFYVDASDVPGDNNVYKSHYSALNAIDKALGGSGRKGNATEKRRAYGIQIIGKKNNETA